MLEANWITRDGNKIAVSDMTESHIENTIQAIKLGKIVFKSKKVSEAWIDVLAMELLAREYKEDRIKEIKKTYPNK